MTFALYLNGVFASGLEEIHKAQAKNPGMVCYLQPYAEGAIKQLAAERLSAANPVTLYLSVTTSLPLVSYRAKIVGWEDKTQIAPARLTELNAHIHTYQPEEKEIYMTLGEGKLCLNLIAVIDLERLAAPIPVSCFTKLSDQMPLKPRSRAGGWSYVRPLSPWVGSLPESAVAEEWNVQLDAAVRESLDASVPAREARLSNAPKRPEAVQIIARGFRRNPDVIASVLHRAQGICEECGGEAPFRRARDDTPYLEVHHRVMLADGGEDTVDNAMAVCPNCHRQLHFGAPRS